MAFEIPGEIVGTQAAGADLSSDQFKGVVLSGATIVLPNSTGPISAFGVLQNGPASGNACTVMRSGVSKVAFAASTLAAGDAFGFSTAGMGIAVDSTAAPRAGVIVEGSSGSAGRLLSCALELL
ncbi:MAG: hypothetical protein QNL12_03240 [Acidimicrobiia bacterium]|nr:hypothetical protein [Acidimicrobiia bacterium]